MPDRHAVLLGQSLGNQGPVTGLRVALDAEQGRFSDGRQRRHDRLEVGVVEDLSGVAGD